MRVLSLDIGEKTIGIAVSDATRFIAQGVETIRRTSKEKDFLRLKELIAEYEVSEIVVGLPKNMNGSIGHRGESVQAFVVELEHEFPEQRIRLWDERLSTVAAERFLLEGDMRRNKRKKVIDKMAAVVILQNFLDSTLNKS